MHKLVKCGQIKYVYYGYKPESLIELVYYNLILVWRKRTGKANLCVWDLNSKEINKFKGEVKNILTSKKKLQRMTKNPFEENEDRTLRKLGIIN